MAIPPFMVANSQHLGSLSTVRTCLALTLAPTVLYAVWTKTLAIFLSESSIDTHHAAARHGFVSGGTFCNIHLIRLIASSTSSGVKSQCLRPRSWSGNRGRNITTIAPTNKAMDPSMMNSHLHGSRPVLSKVSVVCTPYAMRPLKAPEMVAAP